MHCVHGVEPRRAPAGRPTAEICLRSTRQPLLHSYSVGDGPIPLPVRSAVRRAQECLAHDARSSSLPGQRAPSAPSGLEASRPFWDSCRRRGGSAPPRQCPSIKPSPRAPRFARFEAVRRRRWRHGRGRMGLPGFIRGKYLQGIDNAEIIETVHARCQPMIPVSTSISR